jgi:hypothetical protein
MSKFKLICEDEPIASVGSSKIRHEFDCEDLSCILKNMTKFLQFSGYLDNNKHLTLERDINLDFDLDEYTEQLFTGTPVPKE